MKPTILIPGITGTKLADTNRLDFDIVWSGTQSKYESIYAVSYTHLTLPTITE